MKLAIMQPYFFPYIGYFQLINAVDRFILLDEVQYIRHGWVNRNRILKPGGGDQYIIAPLAKHHQKTSIKDMAVLEGSEWKEKIHRQVEHYKKKAPFFYEVNALLQKCFALSETGLSILNAYYLQTICEYIEIKTPIQLSSALSLDYQVVKEKDDWALQISKQLGAAEYINPNGGIGLFDADKYKESNIRLSFLKTDLTSYKQPGVTFEPGLSIIDVLMFNAPEEVRSMLNDYELI